MFDANDNLNFDSAIDIHFKGKKSKEIIPINKDEEQKLKEDEEKIKNILNEKKTKSQSVSEINDYINRIYKQINDSIQDMKDFQSNSIELIENIGDFFDDIDLIIKQLDISLPLKISDVIKKIKKIVKNSLDLDILEKCFYFCQICTFLYYEEYIGYYTKIKEKIDKLKTKGIFLLNAVKNELIKEAKSRIKSFSYDEQIIEDIWDNLKLENKFIDDKIVNDNITSYINKFNIEIFEKDLSELCGKSIKEVNLKNPDPQNIFLKSFMKQQELDYDIDNID